MIGRCADHVPSDITGSITKSGNRNPNMETKYLPSLLVDLLKPSLTSTMDGPVCFAFSSLPPEIRIHVWCLMLNPRVLYTNPTTIWPAVRENPILLKVCKESRSTALRYYQLVCNTYVSFSDDVFYVAYVSGRRPLLPIPTTFSIRLLAIDVEWFLQAGVEVMETINQCQQLQRLKIIKRSEGLNPCEVNLLTVNEADDAVTEMLRDIWLLGRQNRAMPKVSICDLPYAEVRSEASMDWKFNEGHILA